jgi:hypothetical protein
VYGPGDVLCGIGENDGGDSLKVIRVYREI